MSKTLDERVVSMQFDNGNFEKNVNTTMSTLDKLKAKLNFDGASKGLDGISTAASKVNFNPLAAGVEAVTVKFSALEVMAVTALTNITNSAVNAGKNLVKSLSTDQIKAGWQKYEDKTASVQTIMNATGKSIDEVNTYLEKLMWYSDQTSYGFTDMTGALATMTSSGGDIDKLIPMIEGVANATSYAGKGASEFSRVMQYGINQAYSLGVMQMQDWKTIQGATVNSKQLIETLIAAGEELGKIEKGSVTIANFTSTLSDKWLDTDVMEMGFGKFAEVTDAAYDLMQQFPDKYETMSEALDDLAGKYSDVAEKAARSSYEAKSFTEAIDATKDAVSSGWMQTFELIFGNKVEATELWSELCDGLWEMFASGGVERNNLLKDALGGPFEKFGKELESAGISTDAFSEKFIELTRAAQEAATANGYYAGPSIDSLIEKYGSLGAVLRSGELTGTDSLIVKTLEYFAGSAETASGATEDLTGKLEELQGVVDAIWGGDYGNGAARFSKLEDEGYDADFIQGLVNATEEIDGHKLSLDMLSESQLTSMGYTEEQAAAIKELAKQAKESGTPINELIADLNKPTGRELLIDSARNILSGFADIIYTIKDAWADVFPPMTADRLYEIIEKVHEFTVAIKPSEDTLDKLGRTFKGLFAILGIGVDIFKAIVSAIGGPLFGALSDAGGGVLDFTANIGDNIVAFREWLNEDNKIVDGVQKIVEWITKAIDTVEGWIDSFLQIEGVSKAIEDIKGVFDGSGTAILDWFKGLKEAEDIPQYIIDGLVNGLGKGVEDVWNAALELAKGIWDSFCEFLDINSPSKKMEEGGEYVVQGVENGVVNETQGLKDKIVELASNILQWFKEAIGMDSGEESELGQVGEETASSFIDKFLEKFREFNWGQAFAGIIAGGLVVAVLKISSFFSGLGDTFSGVGDVLSSVSDVVEGFKGLGKKVGKVLGAFSFNIKMKAIKDLAIAIAILTGCVVALALVGPGEALKAAGVLAAIVAVLTVFTALVMKWSEMKQELTTFQDIKNFKMDMTLPKFVASLIGIAIALGMLAGVMAILGHMDPDTIFFGFSAMAAILGGMYVFLRECSKVKGLDEKIVKQVGSTLRSIAVTVAIMAIVVAIMGHLDPDTAVFGFGAYAAILALMYVMIKGLEKISKTNPKFLDQVGKTMIKFAEAVAIIAVTVLILSTMADNPDKALAGFGGLVVILFAIAGLMEVIKKMTGADTTMMNRMGRLVVSLAGAMLLMSVVVVILGNMKFDKAIQGIFGVMLMIGVLALLVKVVKSLEKDAPKIGLTVLALATALVVMSAAALLLSFVPLDKLMNAGAAILVLSFAMSMMIVATKDAKDCKKNITAMTIAIGVMAVALVALSFVPWEKLLPAAVALGVVMAALALMMHVAGKMDASGKTIAQILILTVAVGLLGAVLYFLSAQPWQGLLASAVALGLVTLALAAALRLIGKNGDMSLSTLASILLMSVCMGIMGGVLVMLAALHVESALENAVALGLLAVALAVALNIIGGASGNMIVGAAAMLIMSVSLIALAGALAILATVPSDQLITIAVVLAGIIAVIAIASAILSAIIPGALMFVVVVLALSVAVVIAAAGFVLFALGLKMVGEALPAIGIGLQMIGVGIASLVYTVAGCKDAVADFATVLVTIGASTLNMLSSIAQGLIIVAGGMIIFAIGAVVLSVALVAAAVALVILTGAIVLFGLGVALAINAVAQAITAFIEMGQHLVEGFGAGIEAAYSGTIGKVVEFVSGVVNTFKDLFGIHSPSTVLAAIGNYCGLGLSEGLTSSLPSVTDSASGLGDAVKSTILGKLGESSILGKLFGGELADGLGSSSGEVTSSASDLSDLSIDSLNKEKFKWKDTGYESGENYSEGISEGSAISLDMFGGNINDILSNIGGSDSEFSLGGLGNITSYSEGLGDGSSLSLDSFGGNLDGILGNIGDSNSLFGEGGLGNIISYSEGIGSGESTSEEVSAEVADNAALAMKNKYQMFKTVGAYLIEGFKEGIASKSMEAINAAKAMATAAATAARNALQIQSPSKVFYEIGAYAGAGFVNALSDSERSSMLAGESIADSAVGGVKDAISRISDIIEGSVDTQPTIRPIFDISDVSNGVRAINGMMDFDPTIGAMANVNAISYGMNTRQNGTTNDVISALNDLGRKLSNTSGDTYNINGVTYDDGSNITDAVRTIVRAARIERRV